MQNAAISVRFRKYNNILPFKISNLHRENKRIALLTMSVYSFVPLFYRSSRLHRQSFCRECLNHRRRFLVAMPRQLIPTRSNSKSTSSSSAPASATAVTSNPLPMSPKQSSVSSASSSTSKLPTSLASSKPSGVPYSADSSIPKSTTPKSPHKLALPVKPSKDYVPPVLQHALGLSERPRGGQNSGRDTRTWRQRREDTFNYQSHLRRRKEL